MFCEIGSALGGDQFCKSSYFSDSFDGDLNDWFITRGDWGIVDGFLHTEDGESRIFTDLPFSDYMINLSGVTLNEGDGFGIIFRASDESNLDGYTFQYDPGYAGGSFVLRKWENGNEYAPFARNDVADFDWHNTSHDVQLQVEGNTFSAYVDGGLVLQGSDPTYSQGDSAGLRIWDSSDLDVDSVSVDPLD